ncbi:PIN domain-like protein [Sanghuangporus baumii]|uniref:PIN domain-like protein n=1 Tax=Sanghuangporus baumii TaxID=108892 RepID=A0A9Q5HZ51_SANBA|nr:PIN domain-like protein [Sanghuangporus baumii]
MCLEAVSSKIDLAKQLTVVLQGTVKPSQTNKHRYVLSAQSSSIRQYARQVPGVPLVHIKRSVIVLEPASEATERVKSMMEIGRMKPSEAESSNIASTLEKSYATNTDASPIKKKQGPKAPNPLSVKKKKPKENNRQTQSRKHQEQAQSVGSKRKHENDDDDGDGDAQQQEGMDSRPTSQTTSKRTRKRVRKRKRLGMEDSEGGSAINAEVATS